MKKVDCLLLLLQEKLDVKIETDPEFLDYLKVLLEDIDDDFDGDSVVDLLLEYMPKQKVPERQKILAIVLEAIKQDVDVDPQHQATGTPAIKESEETATKVPTEENLTDLIFQTLPPSRISKPSGEPTDSKHRQGRKSSSSPRSVSEKEIDSLCQLFPQICRSELATHLRATAGDVNSAVDQILAGELVNQKSMPPSSDNDCSDFDLPRMTPEERLATMERYGMVDVSSSQTVHRPQLPTAAKGQQESRIRYLNNEVVDTTGKRYIEIKQEYPNLPKPVYLKAARKYRFH